MDTLTVVGGLLVIAMLLLLCCVLAACKVGGDTDARIEAAAEVARVAAEVHEQRRDGAV